MSAPALALSSLAPVSRGAGLLHGLFCTTLLFASADLFFTVDLGPYNLRFVQLLQVLFVVGGAIIVLRRGGRLHLPVGFTALLTWSVFVLSWTFNTRHLAFSVLYSLLFVLSVLVVLSAVQLYANRPGEQVESMFRFYLFSFFVLAVCGVVQFAAALVGVDLLVQQWWIRGVLPRVSAFSYEPSYYATYLLTGWGMLAWLIERRSRVLRRRTLLFWFAVVSLAIVLSSSRIALLVVSAYGISVFVRHLLVTLASGRATPTFLLSVFVVFGVIVLVSWYVLSFVDLSQLRFLLQGTGLAGTAGHSVGPRLARMIDTFEVFQASPLIGHGIGGVWSILAYQDGGVPGDIAGMNVSLEMLAASGVLGFPFFVLFLGLLFWHCFAGRASCASRSELLAAAGIGLALIYIALQFNQGILRVYFWNHIAVISVLVLRWPSEGAPSAAPRETRGAAEVLRGTAGA